MRKYARIQMVMVVFSLYIISTGCRKEEDSTSTTNVSVTDKDGNVYTTITLGTQVWMKENLKTTKYRNGDLIGTTTPATKDIHSESTPKYQWAFDGIESNVALYGRLYTGYAVTDSRGVCPTGWHVPTDAEWTILTNFLTNNGYGYQGSGNDIAKSMASKTGWNTDPTAGNVGNDQASNNSSGFTAFPSSYRHSSAGFYTPTVSYWWSSTEYETSRAYSRYLSYYSSLVYREDSNMSTGFSVRCLRD